jgi:hypothetical protein
MAEDFVRSEPLDLLTTTECVGALIENLRNLYDVSIEVVGTQGLGGIPVRVLGEREAVRSCIMGEWGEGVGHQEDQNFADMMMGDKLAEHRWNTGCEVGLDKPKKSVGPEAIGPVNWLAHWDLAKADVSSYDSVGVQSDTAISALVESGVTNPEDPRVELAQTYLTLALLHWPDLASVLTPERYEGAHRKDS